MMMQPTDYPGLLRGADTASASAQNTYLFVQRLYLGSLILGSIIGTLAAPVPHVLRPWLNAGMAIVLAAGLLVLWLGRSRQEDRAWFDCRAIAESTKTAMWRFMMNVPPFAPNEHSDEQFVSALREIRRARPGAHRFLAGVADGEAPPISTRMRDVRSMPFGDRKLFYIENRLREQKSWYSRKAQDSARGGNRWFWTTAGLQMFALTIAVGEIAIGASGVNVVPLITTCAAAAAAWGQLKRHDELAQSYALATQELAELETIALGLTTETDFPQLVEQVEEAISREHTMWCARRDVLLVERPSTNLPAMGSRYGNQ